MNTSIRIVDVNQVHSGNIVPEITINAYSSLTITAYYRAINFIADNMARFKRSVTHPNAKPKDPPHQLDRLLARRPNHYQNAFVFWRTFWSHFAHAGNGYARIDRGPNFLPIACHNLSPEDVLPVRYTPAGGGMMEQFYIIKSDKVAIHSSDILHVSGLSWDGMWGVDPVCMHDGTFQRASTIDRYTTKFLQKGTIVRGSVEVPGHLDDTQLATMKAYIRQHFLGPDADEDVLVIPDGGHLNNTTISPEQSKLLDQAKHSTKQIAQITGVPPEFLFEMSDTKYINTVEAAGQNVVRYCFGPLIEQAQAEFTLKLLSEADQEAGFHVEIDPDVLMKGNRQAQIDAAVKSKNAGLTTQNEEREELGWPRSNDPKADELVTLGATTVAPPADAPSPTPAT